MLSVLNPIWDNFHGAIHSLVRSVFIDYGLVLASLLKNIISAFLLQTEDSWNNYVIILRAEYFLLLDFSNHSKFFVDRCATIFTWLILDAARVPSSFILKLWTTISHICSLVFTWLFLKLMCRKWAWLTRPFLFSRFLVLFPNLALVSILSSSFLSVRSSPCKLGIFSSEYAILVVSSFCLSLFPSYVPILLLPVVMGSILPFEKCKSFVSVAIFFLLIWTDT